MSKIGQYLQEHLVGEVLTGADVRRHFANDASILQLLPAVVVYPRNENDVRKTARFVWQLAERGKIVPITARGAGSDVAGAALGSAVIMAFPAHLNRILSLDPKKEIVEVEAGINYDKLQQALHTHGLFLPPYPASMQYATLGGAVGNNASGERSFKYGDTRDFTEALRVVLSNGEVIDTRRLNKRELSKKMGLSSFEGEIYRSLDQVIEENWEIIKASHDRVKSVRNSSGYELFNVKRKDGSFDLSSLLVGSQGTLGIITQATMRVASHNPQTTLAVISLPSFAELDDTLQKIRELKPAAMEMLNLTAMQLIASASPNKITNDLKNPSAGLTLLIEFDDFKDSTQKKLLKKLEKIMERAAGTFETATNDEERDRMWAMRAAVHAGLHQAATRAKALPVAEDVAVPIGQLADFLQKAEELYKSHGLQAAIWGHAGDGVVRMQPVLDVGQLGDRQRLFRLADEVYKLVVSLGGSISAGHGDGRMRAPYVALQYGQEMYQLFLKVKQIFDPHNVLNPGVKIGVTLEDLKPLLRSDYTLAHRLEHMPRS